jgi:hypothetical protein
MSIFRRGEYVKWIHFTLDKEQWWAVNRYGSKYLCCTKGREFRTSCATNNFSKRLPRFFIVNDGYVGFEVLTAATVKMLPYSGM